MSVGVRSAQVRRRAGTAQRPIVALEGFDDRGAAEAVRGQELSVEDATPRAEGEWLREELIGCLVADGERELGRVTELVALPSCEALEVTRADGEMMLVPLVADAVRAVDVEGARVDVDLAFVAPEE